MKILPFLLVILCLIFQSSSAQIEDIFKKIPGVGDMFEEAVSTSIKDAYPSAVWLKELDKQIAVSTDTRYSKDLSAGFFRFKFNTFCLHAGTYAPTEGDGYLVAPLKGAKAKLIERILSRYSEHPEIDQKDVQTLIWGIEAGMKFSQYPVDFSIRIKPLLTTEEIASMEVDVKEIAYELLPQDVKDVLNLYATMRGMIADVNTTYEQLEQIAVRTGTAPWGKGSKRIDAGTWTSVGDGVYIRCFPFGYQQSDVEFYQPREVAINKDAQSKITSLKFGTDGIDISYDAGKPVFTMNGQTLMPESDFKNEAAEFAKLVKKSLKKKAASRLDTKMLTELKNIELSLKSALNITEPSQNNFYRIAVDAVNNLISEAESGTRKGGSNSFFNMSSFVFAPANTSLQRLGTSGDGTGGEKEKEKEKKDCKVSVLIHQVNQTELPEPDHVYSVPVDIFIEGNDEQCNAEEIQFTLFDVTTERGRFLNDKAKMNDNTPDLAIYSGYTNPDYNVTEPFTASKPISGKSQTQTINITCNDYGAYGKLKVSVKVKGNWYEADADGAPDKFITIPTDFNNNKIADYWEKQNNVFGLAADWDEDPTPSGQARNGDGMTNYEEYRGFMVDDGSGGKEHIRTQPKEKEIFVIDEGQIFDISTWKSASGIKAYWLTTDLVFGSNGGGELNQDYRWVNFCSGYAKGLKYSVLLKKIDGITDPYTLCGTGTDYTGCNKGSPVKNAQLTVVLPDRIKKWLTTVRDTLSAWLTRMPKGFKLGGKNYTAKTVKKFIDDLNNTAKFNEIVNFYISQVAVHEVGHALGIPHHGKNEAGSKNCPMRYFEYMDPVDFNSTKLGNVLDLIEKEGTVLVSYTSWKFCKSQFNCWSKLDANDR